MLGVPKIRDSNILGSILGSPYLGKLPLLEAHMNRVCGWLNQV